MTRTANQVDGDSALPHEFGAPERAPRVLVSSRYVIGEFAVRPDVRVRNHQHEGEAIVLVLDGGLVDAARVGSREGESMAPGTVRILPAGDRRDLTFGPNGAVCLVIELSHRLERDSGLVIRHRALSSDPRLAALARRLRRHLDRLAPCAAVPLELDLLELLAQLSRDRRPVRYLSPPSWLARVRDELASALRMPDLDDLGRRACVHPLHLVRSFRDHYGCRMGEVVRRHRLERAFRAITESEAPLSLVAAECGFADQSHMTREVTRVFSAPPARLRRVHR